MKTILIGIPCNVSPEKDTLRSLWNLRVPEGYEVKIEMFHGYNIDQIRNLIADWMVKGPFTHLFSVDSDIVVPQDALVKMLAHDKDIVSGVYVQRKDDMHIPEIYFKAPNGNYIHYDNELLKRPELREIAACGFGCVLVKKEVFTAMPYPHFLYTSSVDHANTCSEDVYFCIKAAEKGKRIFVDTSIRCGHVGKTTFHPDATTVQQRLRYLSSVPLLPAETVQYLHHLKDTGVNPAVAYDIGSCVLHWTNVAQQVWPSSTIVAFDGVEEVEFLYRERNIQFFPAILGATFGPVIWHSNPYHPGGNSIYRENPAINPMAEEYYPTNQAKWRVRQTLDGIMLAYKLPTPDLLKMDVQGAEMDVLLGASMALKSATNVILELQTVEYNTGAPNATEVIAFMERRGFRLVQRFSETPYDADYHFQRQ
jgi:FkbM family methyltransferase